MANLTSTQLLAAITKANNSIMGAAEFRDYEHSSVRLLLNSQNSVFRNLNALKQSDEQPTKVDLFVRAYVASGSAKTYNHAAAGFQDSMSKDVSYIKRVQKFKVSYKQAANNRFGYDEILQAAIKNSLMSMYADLSTYVTGWLETNRSQVAVSSLMPYVGSTTFTFNNALADKASLFENIKAAAKKNKYNTPLDVVADQRMAAQYRQQGAQGPGNSTNLTYQMPGIELVEEAQLTASAGGTGYFWQKGLVGMTTWNESANRAGLGDVGNNEGLFTTMADPILPTVVHDLHVIRSVADTSGSAGNVQDIVDEYEMACIFTVQGAWQSTANATPIFKVNQLNA